jgi:nucleotide-binding universal stress UspA family protein
MYKKILVAVDGSKASKRGLEEAIRIATFTGATLRLVHVINELVLEPNYMTANTFDRLIDGLRAGGRVILDDATAAALKAGVSCEGKLIESMGGQAAISIVQEAREWQADLIVMGTHGRRGIRRLALGSDAETVLRSASVPLLLVRDSPEAS